MTTAGIKWCNDGIPEIFDQKHVFDQKFRNLDFCLKLPSPMQMQNWKPHPNLSTQTQDMTF